MDIVGPSHGPGTMTSFADDMMFDADEFDILDSGVAGEISKMEDCVKTEPVDSSWISMKNTEESRGPKLFRTRTGLQRTATYTTTTSHLYEQRAFMDETSRAVSSVDEPEHVIEEDEVDEEHEHLASNYLLPEDEHTEEQLHLQHDPSCPSTSTQNSLESLSSAQEPSPSTSQPSRPLQRLTLMIGKKVLHFKVIDALRPPDFSINTGCIDNGGILTGGSGVASASSMHVGMHAGPCHSSSALGSTFRCSVCKMAFSTKDQWSKHMQAFHTLPKSFNCVMCGLGFTTKASLSIHHRTHSNYKAYQCNICHKTFSRASNHNLHMKMHQSGLRHFCQVCGRCFKKVDVLIEHQMTCVALMSGEYIHTDRPLRYQCSYCDKLFHHKRDKFIHERIHTGEKPYQCGYCGRGFTQSQGLTIHIRLHTGERPYTCLVCGKQYRDNSALRKHEYKHHVPTAADLSEPLYEPELDDGTAGLLDDDVDDDDYSTSIWNDRA